MASENNRYQRFGAAIADLGVVFFFGFFWGVDCEKKKSADTGAGPNRGGVAGGARDRGQIKIS